MRVGRSSAFARVHRRGPGGPPGAVAHSPCGEARAGTRSVGWSGAGAHSPCGEARRRSRCGGRTGAGARSLRGGAAPVALWWADRRRCTLPLRRGACRSRCGGRAGAGARSPCEEAHAGHAVVGGSAQVHAPLAGRRMPVTLWRADRRRCTLPLRGGARRSRCGGRTGAGARFPYAGRRMPVTLWRADRRCGARSPCGEARRRSRCGGRTGAGARSPRGEARNIGCLSLRGAAHMFVP